jgi:hypothetical protein
MAGIIPGHFHFQRDFALTSAAAGRPTPFRRSTTA